MRTRTIVLLFLTAFIAGCRSTTVETNNGPAGVLTGKVNLVDRNRLQLSDRSGVLVQCVGTSDSTLSDSFGNWTLHNMYHQTYQIKFSKQGYTSWTDPSYTFTGTDTAKYYHSNVTLVAENPMYTIILDELSMPKGYYDAAHRLYVSADGEVVAHTSDAIVSGLLECSCYFGHSPSIVRENTTSYQYSTFIEGTANITSDSVTLLSGRVSSQDPNKFFTAFKPGDTMYVRAYPYLLQDKFDPVTGNYYSDSVKTQGSNVLWGVMQ
ncbi:MAG TPA: hypothetical protein VEW28_01970 [Candidatus Kapabacteria bacterium]|nr:hypothetical protein [Candidatus Kapabacteria bacterium]